MENDAKLMEILRGLDDPEAPEWPGGYLAHRYDGPTLMPFSGSADPTWWDRFFGVR